MNTERKNQTIFTEKKEKLYPNLEESLFKNHKNKKKQILRVMPKV